MKKISWLLFAFVMFLAGIGEAYAQEGIALLKFDLDGDVPEEIISYMNDALRTEILNAGRGVNTDASDTSYTEMQMLYDCDPETPIACYETACSNLGTSQLILGTINDDKEVNVKWYVSGKGIFREHESVINTKEDAVKLAKRLIVGDIGYITVTSNVPGADILIDEKRVGMTAEYVENAQKLELRAGKYVLSIVSEGYVTNTQTITIDGFQDENIHVELAEVVDYEALRKKFDIAGYSLIGAGGAMLIAGGAMHAYMRFSLQDDFNKYPSSEEAKQASLDENKKWMEEKNNLGKGLAIGGDVLYGVGGLLAAGGVALILVRHLYKFEGEELQEEMSAEPTASRIPSIDFAVTPEYQGMTLGWKF